MAETTDINRCSQRCPSCGCQCVGILFHPDGDEHSARYEMHGDENEHTWKAGDISATDNSVKIKVDGNWMPIKTYFELYNSGYFRNRVNPGEIKPLETTRRITLDE